MEVMFQKEPLATAYEDAKVLFERHWDEIGTTKEAMPYSPNLPAYAELERLGMLHILTCRDKSTGHIIGYFYTIVMPHLHYSTSICSFCDIFFLDREHRQGFLGLRLLREATKMLQSLGVVKSFIPVKLAHPQAGPLLERLGYKPHEVVYTKLLTED